MRLVTALLAALIMAGALAVGAQEDTEALSPTTAANERTTTEEGEAPAVAADEEIQPSADPEQEEPLPVERITFSLPFTSETGGGIASGTAGTLEYVQENLVIASDAVEFAYQNIKQDHGRASRLRPRHQGGHFLRGSSVRLTGRPFRRG
jgi:hypothetical protein